jgi:large subunit ribosomal protein L30
MVKLKVTWKKSVIGRPERQRRTIRALGLRRLNHVVVHQDTPQIRGMLRAVSHLVQWEELSE